MTNMHADRFHFPGLCFLLCYARQDQQILLGEMEKLAARYPGVRPKPSHATQQSPPARCRSGV